VDGADPQARQLATTLPLHAPRGGHGHQSDRRFRSENPRNAVRGGRGFFLALPPSRGAPARPFC
jgi:hypothetical protein